MDKKTYGVIDNIENTHWWYVVRREILTKVIKRHKSKANQILDIGAGNGGNLEFLEKHGAVTSIEYAEEAVDIFKARHPNKLIFQGFLPDGLPEEVVGKKFDLITLLDVLEHIDDEKQSLKVISNLLNDDGIILITVPAYKFLWSKTDEVAWHKRRYTKRRLKELMTSGGFEVCYLSYFNTVLFPLEALVRLLSKLNKNYNYEKEFNISSKIVNEALKFIFGIEKLFIPNISLPFGLSICGVFKKQR